jgi:polysaccharide pyruvyl transferase WcaK-like protein
MYLISNSKIFIGTSLHGIITAMSYMVPYIGVFKENRKIDEYLKTWGIDGLNYSHSELELLEKVSFAMNLPKEVLRNKLDDQVNKVKYSLSLIRNIIVGQQK